MFSTADALEVSRGGITSCGVGGQGICIHFFLTTILIPDMGLGEEEVAIKEFFRSAEASFTTEVSFCCVGLGLGLVVLLGLYPVAVATLGISSSAILLIFRA